MRILLANPRGFCAGVDRAIEIVERALDSFGAPIYVRHEVVHNRHVVERLRALGAVFVQELHQVPDGATVIFSAHGVSNAVVEEARRRQLQVFDATCPLVTKVHMEVGRFAREAREVILIGHAGHPEVEGTMGRFDASLGGRITLIESVLCYADHTIGGRHRSHRECAAGALSVAAGSPKRGYLLCHTEPAGCG
jgi:4-hydroxy-3-methylbut-2-enyl diphosphate reductase